MADNENTKARDLAIASYEAAMKARGILSGVMNQDGATANDISAARGAYMKALAVAAGVGVQGAVGYAPAQLEYANYLAESRTGNVDEFVPLWRQAAQQKAQETDSAEVQKQIITAAAEAAYHYALTKTQLDENKKYTIKGTISDRAIGAQAFLDTVPDSEISPEVKAKAKELIGQKAQLAYQQEQSLTNDEAMHKDKPAYITLSSDQIDEKLGDEVRKQFDIAYAQYGEQQASLSTFGWQGGGDDRNTELRDFLNPSAPAIQTLLLDNKGNIVHQEGLFGTTEALHGAIQEKLGLKSDLAAGVAASLQKAAAAVTKKPEELKTAPEVAAPANARPAAHQFPYGVSQRLGDSHSLATKSLLEDSINRGLKREADREWADNMNAWRAAENAKRAQEKPARAAAPVTAKPAEKPKDMLAQPWGEIAVSTGAIGAEDRKAIEQAQARLEAAVAKNAAFAQSLAAGQRATAAPEDKKFVSEAVAAASADKAGDVSKFNAFLSEYATKTNGVAPSVNAAEVDTALKKVEARRESGEPVPQGIPSLGQIASQTRKIDLGVKAAIMEAQAARQVEKIATQDPQKALDGVEYQKLEQKTQADIERFEKIKSFVDKDIEAATNANNSTAAEAFEAQKMGLDLQIENARLRLDAAKGVDNKDKIKTTQEVAEAFTKVALEKAKQLAVQSNAGDLAKAIEKEQISQLTPQEMRPVEVPSEPQKADVTPPPAAPAAVEAGQAVTAQKMDAATFDRTAELERQLAAERAKSEALAKENAELKEANTALKTELDAVKKELSQAKEELDGKMKALGEQVNQLRADQKQMKTELDAAKAETAKAKAEAEAAKQAEIDAVKQAAAAAKAEGIRPKAASAAHHALTPQEKAKLKPILRDLVTLSDGNSANDHDVSGIGKNKFLTSAGVAEVWEKTHAAIDKMKNGHGNAEDVAKAYREAMKEAGSHGEVRNVRGKRKQADHLPESGRDGVHRVRDEIRKAQKMLNSKVIGGDEVSSAEPAAPAAAQAKRSAELEDRSSSRA